MKIKSLALYCGSSNLAMQKYVDLAIQFGKIVAQKQITLIYGGASVGLMGAAAHAALYEGGKVTGVAPSFFNKESVLSNKIDQLILVKSMSERKQMFEKMADAFVIFPGSYGTMDELFEIVTNAQLGMHSKPVIILNSFGYYDHLIAQLETFLKEGFLNDFHYSLLIFCSSIDEIFSKIDNYEPAKDTNWLSKIRSISL